MFVQKVYVVMDIYGTTESVQITSTPSTVPTPTSSLSLSLSLNNSSRSRTNIARKQTPSNFLSQQRKVESKCSYQQLCRRYLARLALPGKRACDEVCMLLLDNSPCYKMYPWRWENVCKCHMKPLKINISGKCSSSKLGIFLWNIGWTS